MLMFHRLVHVAQSSEDLPSAIEYELCKYDPKEIRVTLAFSDDMKVMMKKEQFLSNRISSPRVLVLCLVMS